MGKFIIAAFVVCLFGMAVTLDPPVWPSQFSQRFVTTFRTTNGTFYSPGEHWYDAKNNRSRFHYDDGQHDFLCGSVVTGPSPCEFLTVAGKRYLVFPDKKMGCMCCTAAQGCGVLKPNWLEGGKYEGKESLLGQEFNKWSKPDGDMMDYYYETTDTKRVPRRIDQGPSRTIDYLMNTYNTSAMADSVFDIPSYVKGDCPATSKCNFSMEMFLHDN